LVPGPGSFGCKGGVRNEEQPGQRQKKERGRSSKRKTEKKAQFDLIKTNFRV